MKKFLTAFILLVFCTIQATWAGDIVIVGSDGQARYEDESKNIPVIQNTTGDLSRKQAKNLTDTNDKVTNLSNIQGKNELDSSLKVAEHQKIIKEANTSLYDTDQILLRYGYELKDNSSKTNKEYIKMDLLDGDYMIKFKDAPYIAEYHKNGDLMGIIQEEDIIKDSNKKIKTIGYEYRIGYNTEKGMGLKHIIFIDFEKNNYYEIYIYNNEGNLLCRQINNDIYIADEARNMLPNWSKKQTITVKQGKKKKKISMDEVLNAIAFPFKLIGYGICILGIGLLIMIFGI